MPPRKSDVAKAATVAPTTKDSSPLPQAAPSARAVSVPEGQESIEKATASAGHPHSSSKGGINLEDLSLPKSITARLAKAPLPPGTAIQATALLGIQKCATVFVNYLANQANEYAQGAGRKTVGPQDVLRAVEEIGWGAWREGLEGELKVFEGVARAKRDKVKGGSGAGGGGEGGGEVGRPRKKLKGHRGEEMVEEEVEEVQPEEDGEGDGGEKAEGDEAEEEEGDDAEEDEDGEDEEQDEGNGDEDEEDEQLRVRGKSEDEALDNGDESD